MMQELGRLEKIPRHRRQHPLPSSELRYQTFFAEKVSGMRWKGSSRVSVVNSLILIVESYGAREEWEGFASKPKVKSWNSRTQELNARETWKAKESARKILLDDRFFGSGHRPFATSGGHDWEIPMVSRARDRCLAGDREINLIL